MATVNKIGLVKTDRNDRPLEKVAIQKVEVKEAAQNNGAPLERLGGDPRKGKL